MKRRTVRIWSLVVVCIGMSFLLEYTISQSNTSFAATNNLLASTDQASGSSVQQHLKATVAALVRQNARQATALAHQDRFISSLATEVAGQNRAATVDALVQENAYRATDVAALYLALGSPAPTTPPTPTVIPSVTPIPSKTVSPTPTLTRTNQPT